MYYNTYCIESLLLVERRFICFKMETMALKPPDFPFLGCIDGF